MPPNLQESKEMLIQELLDVLKKMKTVELVENLLKTLDDSENEIKYTEQMLELIKEINIDCEKIKVTIDDYIKKEEESGHPISLSIRKILSSLNNEHS